MNIVTSLLVWIATPLVRSVLEEIKKEDEKVLIWVLPGGRLPERKSHEAIGYDAFARAIVSVHEMESEGSPFRKTLFDFKTMPTDPEIARRIIEDPKTKRLGYRMRKGESIMIGMGFVTAMKFPLFFWVTPRSGLSSKHGITVTNAPGTVDPDYRGEAGVLLYNRENEYFDVFYEMRIAQDLFQKAVIPTFNCVPNLSDLPKSMCGSNGFGSTGLYG